jgi:hypothetical protein
MTPLASAIESELQLAGFPFEQARHSRIGCRQLPAGKNVILSVGLGASRLG